jgi:hypothetical protein
MYARLMKKGLHHNQAMCALARKAAARTYAIMKRLEQNKIAVVETKVVSAIETVNLNYQLRDLDGRLIDNKSARAIILEKFPSKKKRLKEKRGSSSFNLVKDNAQSAFPKNPVAGHISRQSI